MDMRMLLQEEKNVGGVSIVPVIDLSLVLLIILMVTSPLLDTADLPVKLPQARTIESKDRNVAITFSPDGRLAINKDEIEESQLIPKLREIFSKDPDIMVILRVDRESPYISLTELITRCKKAGARRISIGIEQEKVEG